MSNFVVGGPMFTGLRSPNVGGIAVEHHFSDCEYLDPFQRYSRWKFEVVRNHPEFSTFLVPRFVLGESPKF